MIFLSLALRFVAARLALLFIFAVYCMFCRHGLRVTSLVCTSSVSSSFALITMGFCVGVAVVEAETGWSVSVTYTYSIHDGFTTLTVRSVIEWRLQRDMPCFIPMLGLRVKCLPRVRTACAAPYSHHVPYQQPGPVTVFPSSILISSPHQGPIPFLHLDIHDPSGTHSLHPSPAPSPGRASRPQHPFLPCSVPAKSFRRPVAASASPSMLPSSASKRAKAAQECRRQLLEVRVSDAPGQSHDADAMRKDRGFGVVACPLAAEGAGGGKCSACRSP